MCVCRHTFVNGSPKQKRVSDNSSFQETECSTLFGGKPKRGFFTSATNKLELSLLFRIAENCVVLSIHFTYTLISEWFYTLFFQA